MKSSGFFTCLFIIAATACACNKQKDSREPVKIIFDTDLGPDYDDVGAMAFLHAMADSGRAEILATVSSNKHSLVGPSLDVLNTWFGRPTLLLGAPKAQAVDMGAWQHWPDSLIARYPHRVMTTNELPDAVQIYRQILYEQPDTSVTVVTVGFLTNLSGLLQSPPDSLCPLTGKELVSKKVKILVSMAGKFPEGKEFNVHMDSVSSRYVFENWPTTIIFTGFEIGWEIRTGLRLIREDAPDGPVKDVFRICIPMSEEGRNGRMSWDETAVLIAVYGTQDFFDTVRGHITVQPDGSNGWVNDPQGRHTYVVQKMPADRMTRFIEDRMMHTPLNRK